MSRPPEPIVLPPALVTPEPSLMDEHARDVRTMKRRATGLLVAISRVIAG